MSDEKAIYVLQVFERVKRDEENPRRGERNIGWFSSLDLAKYCLHTNKDVIGEVMPVEGSGVECPYYLYALIEKVYEGPYSCGLQGDEDDVKFFHWDVSISDYVEIPRPKELQGVVGFTIG